MLPVSVISACATGTARGGWGATRERWNATNPPAASPSAIIPAIASIHLPGIPDVTACFLPSAFCLLLSAFCFLPSAFCFLPSAACRLNATILFYVPWTGTHRHCVSRSCPPSRVVCAKTRLSHQLHL